MRVFILGMVAVITSVNSGCQPATVPNLTPPASSVPAKVAVPQSNAAPPQSVALPNPELDAARRKGWESVELILATLEEGDESQSFPGIEAWVKELRQATAGVDAEKAPAEWPAFDIDQLVTHNPRFWQAHYEIAPGDPGLHLLHAGLLLSAGEVNRADYLAIIALQRPGVPDEVRGGLAFLHNQAQQAQAASNAVVQEGIEQYDAGNYAPGLAKHDAALAIWPQNGFAHYERGLTLFALQLQASGEEVPDTASVRINEGPKLSAEVQAAYAAARKHDPFQFRAWQGDDKQVIAGLMALVQKGMPAWKQVQNADRLAGNATLEELAEALQDAGTHDLALVIRQILVARRGRYEPADHPFITTSLQQLAPGDSTDAVLKRLWDGPVVARQIIAAPIEETFAPESPAPPANAAFELKQLRMYVPLQQVQERLGPEPLQFANYVKALEKKAAEIVAAHSAVDAPGLLIAVGIKSPTKTRIWCQAVEGELPPELLEQLQTELAAIKACALKKSPMAFGLEIGLNGESPTAFPQVPAAWQEEAIRTNTQVLNPPDELFKTLWPMEE